MKHLFLFSAFVIIVSTFGCSEHSLSPENECNIPQDLTKALSGSSWIYKRTLLDASGNPTTGNASMYDTLTLLGRDPSLTKDGEIAMKLEDHYSNDGGLTFRRDTIYWVINSSMFYVNNVTIQNQNCNCFYGKDMKWRIYEDCGEADTKIIDSTFLGDTYPSRLPNGDITYTQTNLSITNRYKTIGSEPIIVEGKSMSTKKSQSFVSMISKIISPEDATFAANGKRNIEINDNREIWTNRDIGVVKERGVNVDNSNSGVFNLPLNFERTLVKYTILK